MKATKRCGALYPWELHALTPYEWESPVCNIPLDRHLVDSSGKLTGHIALGRFLGVLRWKSTTGQRFKRGGPNYPKGRVQP